MLSVLTATRNREASLQRLSDSLITVYPREWIVADDSTVPLWSRRKEMMVYHPLTVGGSVAALSFVLPKCHGKYVMLLADDCEVYPWTVDTAVRFMEDHPSVGQGALYVKTTSHGCHLPPWHGRLYAQFWIVLRTVGERVGWHDPTLKHAGADNDLSSKILDAGFGVVGIPGACVKDHDVRDATHADTTNHAQADMALVEARWKDHKDRLTRFWEEHWKAVSGPWECGRTHG